MSCEGQMRSRNKEPHTVLAHSVHATALMSPTSQLRPKGWSDPFKVTGMAMAALDSLLPRPAHFTKTKKRA